MEKASFTLPWPAKILWPNGRGHWSAKSRATKNHRTWAFVATKACDIRGPFSRWSVIFHPKTRHQIDDDNARASLKAYQDGIAQALGVDDRTFPAPTILFGEPIKGGLLSITIEAGE